jgi:hypothetical protein
MTKHGRDRRTNSVTVLIPVLYLTNLDLLDKENILHMAGRTDNQRQYNRTINRGKQMKETMARAKTKNAETSIKKLHMYKTKTL